MSIISSAAKRTFSMRATTSPSSSPKKKRERKAEAQSAIRTALGMSKDVPRGLLRFFHQNSRDEYNEQVRKHTAEENESAQQRQEKSNDINQRRVERVKEVNRKRQQRHRQKGYNKQIEKGERSPGGTKQKRKVRIQFEFD
jgi:hypothetical protein